MTTSELGKSSGPLLARTVGDITVLSASGPLHVVAADLDRAVRHALADEPRAVVCDLTLVKAPAAATRPDLLPVTQEVAAWPGTPLVVASPDPAVVRVLRGDGAVPPADPPTVHPSVDLALAELRSQPVPVVARTPLAPRATASREARDFATRTCLDWGIRHEMASVSLVVSELVSNAVLHAVPDLGFSMAHHGSMLRLAVRDCSPTGPPHQRSRSDRTSGRGMMLIGALSRAWGVLPTADGGKVVWAVLEA